jgi:hypothetical protein
VFEREARVKYSYSSGYIESVYIESVYIESVYIESVYIESAYIESVYIESEKAIRDGVLKFARFALEHHVRAT